MNKLPPKSAFKSSTFFVRAIASGNRSAFRYGLQYGRQLFVDAGKACADYQDRAPRNLTCKRIQLDEFGRSSTPSKERIGRKAAPAVLATFGPGLRSTRQTKLVPSWHVSDRSSEAGWPL